MADDVSVSALVVARTMCELAREKGQEMDRTKLQCLLYYAQAAHLAWFERPMFRDEIYAAPSGPRIKSIDKASRKSLGLGPMRETP